MRWPLIASAGLIAFAAYQWSVQQVDPLQAVSDAIDSALSGLENMQIDPFEAVSNGNVQAFLAMIRVGEGTSDSNGYRRIFGGRLFDSFADHPRIKVTASGYTSTAAGAYQFLAKTWDACRNALGLADFSPASQDVAAVYLIKGRGALADVINGRFEAAIAKCAKEWASLPGSPYGQPTQSLAGALAIIQNKGGAFA
jgi:lysozyme